MKGQGRAGHLPLRQPPVGHSGSRCASWDGPAGLGVRVTLGSAAAFRSAFASALLVNLERFGRGRSVRGLREAPLYGSGWKEPRQPSRCWLCACAVAAVARCDAVLLGVRCGSRGARMAPSLPARGLALFVRCDAERKRLERGFSPPSALLVTSL